MQGIFGINYEDYYGDRAMNAIFRYDAELGSVFQI
jgi:hypothetical protein